MKILENFDVEKINSIIEDLDLNEEYIFYEEGSNFWGYKKQGHKLYDFFFSVFEKKNFAITFREVQDIELIRRVGITEFNDENIRKIIECLIDNVKVKKSLYGDYLIYDYEDNPNIMKRLEEESIEDEEPEDNDDVEIETNSEKKIDSSADEDLEDDDEDESEYVKNENCNVASSWLSNRIQLIKSGLKSNVPKETHHSGEVVSIKDIVTIKWLDTEEVEKFQIFTLNHQTVYVSMGGSYEAAWTRDVTDPNQLSQENNEISSESPIGRALIGRAKNDVVMITTDNTKSRYLEILRIDKEK